MFIIEAVVQDCSRFRSSEMKRLTEGSIRHGLLQADALATEAHEFLDHSTDGSFGLLFFPFRIIM